MNRVLRVGLTGGEARLGRVPASDVAKLLLGVERAVARATGDVVGRRVKQTDRWGKVIESAVRFRLVGIEEGSVVGVLELPDLRREPNTLDLDTSTLGETGLIAALKTALGGEDADPDVAGAFVKLADGVGVGSRYDAVSFETDIQGVPERIVVDAPARQRLSEVAEQAAPEARADTLVGVLVEADFERFTARLRAADGQPVAVNFDEDQADEIQEALRSAAEFIGEITYDAHTSRAVRVELRATTRAEQLAMSLEAGEFWWDVTIDDLRVERGISAVTDTTELGDPELTNEEADAFLAALS